VQALIDNKSDLPNEVSHDRIKEYRKEFQIKLHCFVSAKTGECVVKAFNDLIAAIHHHNITTPKENHFEASVKVVTKQSKCVCS